MRKLLRSIGQLSRRRKIIVGAMILLVVSTWLGACLVFASYLAQ
jgi:hypothetical protein